VHETEPVDQEGIFHIEGIDDLREEEEQPSTTSSSEDDVSTDALERRTSTPTTTPSSFVESPPSPKLLAHEPVVHAQPSSTTQSEGTKKKKFWSRIVSNVKKPSSSKGGVPSAVSHNEHSTDIGRSPPRSDSKQVIQSKGRFAGEVSKRL